MSSTSQVTTFSDLYTDLINRVKSNTSSADMLTQAKRFINIALQDMHIGQGEKFLWAQRSETLLTQPSYSTGTVTISKGSTSLTGSGTAWNTNNDFGVANARAGGKVIIDGSVVVYDVASVDSDTGITLSQKFVGDDASGAGYTYFEDEYALDADFLRPLSFTSFDIRGEIPIMERAQFRRRFSRNHVTGKPVVACILDKSFSGNTTPVRKVQFHRPPDQAYQIPYDFITNKLAVAADGTEKTSLSSDDDEPIVPLAFRHAIVFHALYHWYRDRRDDNRAQSAKKEYEDLVIRVINDTEVGAPRPRMHPRVGAYSRAAKRPYARGSSRYSADSRFDEIRDR